MLKERCFDDESVAQAHDTLLEGLRARFRPPSPPSMAMTTELPMVTMAVVKDEDDAEERKRGEREREASRTALHRLDEAVKVGQANGFMQA
jgi:hypothetical protein